MEKPRYKIAPGGAYSLFYHFVWCPKYRRPVLTGEVESDLRALLIEKASDMGIEIEEMEIMPDHVHIFVSAPPVWGPHEIANSLKGFTSNRLRKSHQVLRSRLPTLWSRSYFVGSVGSVTSEAIKKYIRDQKRS